MKKKSLFKGKNIEEGDNHKRGVVTYHSGVEYRGVWEKGRPLLSQKGGN